MFLFLKDYYERLEYYNKTAFWLDKMRFCKK